ncbi:High-affinity zinc uptake system membrane protein znuB [Vibrio nigripulchritudo SFn27]|uniref:High-affinity zinc uptake system membrane protein ZnuB n=1 Tax=Vibrio nigripulchritudo TaxID=28173 RepID=U4K7N1_9VIBR|nr:zinc ABC transporter permease subunit ZnuB [Vibrio nigripulchritudo]CCN85041.1 High-affinity zinc uptake system membrane protein znuB [Vibrio nigripulchritudo BLFn1]CCN90253.1 High-affinity zinc uptake system membrane protein znuB [Vibrio nigripulchritudo SFn27]CCN94134.1 High-affinity zinc uptake system membrane protein znuB [Vibrio nigripulchritudo ENn2]CCO42488.1 High-affinity zinc uptake system membrane protein znuB [Vibrio nigripulchritudo SFn135]CCO51409.1 High-affinity zinc uptake sy
MIEFLLPSIIAGIAIALIAGPLGSFVVWRRMAYFGDTLAHASLLGLSLGFLLDINIYLALVVCCVALAMILVTLQKQKVVATDTLLGILAHSSLSLGLVAISFFDNVRVDLMGYLFGDLLAVSPEDLTFIFAGGMFIIAVLVYFWQPLLSSSVNEELANIEGINTDFMRLILMLLVGIVIAVGMKFVGALLITSLMIIPAAAARRFSSTPEQMAVLSSVFGVIAVLSGLTFSWNLDTPAGPSVVISAAMIFILSQFKRVTH